MIQNTRDKIQKTENKIQKTGSMTQRKENSYSMQQKCGSTIFLDTISNHNLDFSLHYNFCSLVVVIFYIFVFV